MVTNLDRTAIVKSIIPYFAKHKIALVEAAPPHLRRKWGGFEEMGQYRLLSLVSSAASQTDHSV